MKPWLSSLFVNIRGAQKARVWQSIASSQVCFRSRIIRILQTLQLNAGSLEGVQQELYT
jgi:hypothetical protein